MSHEGGAGVGRVHYVWSAALLAECDRLPAVPARASLVHELISSYGLLESMTVVLSKAATDEDLKEFHSALYIDHLKKMRPVDDDYEVDQDDEDVGIGYDCTPVADLYRLVGALAGGTITAARSLICGARVAINWCGGWHHAQRFQAEGFCYVNDIVIGIEKLRRHFPRVLYVDLDIHHGNGVEDAYAISRNVFTLSLHKREPGFYPGSGCTEDVGSLRGKGYTCNFPFRDGVSDPTLTYAFDNVFPLVVSKFEADAIVVQCGADSLSGDPLGGANVTPTAVCQCVRRVLDLGKPVMLLGGGGYNKANTARLWAGVTAAVVGRELSDEIPDNQYFTEYGPAYDLEIRPSNKRDNNDKDYLDACILKIKDNLNKYIDQS